LVIIQSRFTFFKNINSNVIAHHIRMASERFDQSIILGSLTLMNEIMVLVLIVIGITIYNIEILFLIMITVVPSFFVFYSLVRKRSTRLG
jgi:hypothetical protein